MCRRFYWVNPVRQEPLAVEFDLGVLEPPRQTTDSSALLTFAHRYSVCSSFPSFEDAYGGTYRRGWLNERRPARDTLRFHDPDHPNPDLDPKNVEDVPAAVVKRHYMIVKRSGINVQPDTAHDDFWSSGKTTLQVVFTPSNLSVLWLIVTVYEGVEKRCAPKCWVSARFDKVPQEVRDMLMVKLTSHLKDEYKKHLAQQELEFIQRGVREFLK